MNVGTLTVALNSVHTARLNVYSFCIHFDFGSVCDGFSNKQQILKCLLAIYK